MSKLAVRPKKPFLFDEYRGIFTQVVKQPRCEVSHFTLHAFMLWKGTTSSITSVVKMFSACKGGNLIQILQRVIWYCVSSFCGCPRHTSIHTTAGTATSTKTMTASLQVLIFAPHNYHLPWNFTRYKNQWGWKTITNRQRVLMAYFIAP
jgi:hypothetical protein